MQVRNALAAALAGLCLFPHSALGSFHFMQIERVIGGVHGNSSVQAIQLRMRSSSQNFVSLAPPRAWDASGGNPILITDFNANVSNGATGARVLVASSNFAVNAQGLTPDFIMGNLIPSSYLSAGRITFEDDFGTIYWSLAFGGANYTGSTTGSTTNDVDGNFGPPFPGPLPSSNTQALQFTGTATALSTNNLAQYALTAGAAFFNNNAGTTGTVAPRLGDANLDGLVNSSDFGILVANYGGNAKTWSQADFDANTKVNTLDFNILAGNFGTAAALPGSVVPEPALSATLSIALLSVRRRHIQ